MNLKAIGALTLLAWGASASAQSADEARWIGIARGVVTAEASGAPMPKVTGSTPVRPVFVTIEVNGVVRGCRGDLMPRTRSLEEEIALAARGAAAHDPRYRPIEKDELRRFLVTVTIVDRTEPLGSVRGVGPEDGIVLTSDGRTGVVLPWEGRDPQTRLGWAYRKAGVGRSASVALRRLVATRFRG